jgi:predicted phosphodiesterase
MTRVVIFSDLHANWEALLALQQAENQPDMILCLGDIVGYGPDPKRCLDVVRTSATHIIGGRHDLAVGITHSYTGDDLLEATWTHARSLLPQADLDYLAALPPNLSVDVGGIRFYLTRLAPDDTAAETHMLITMSQLQLRERFDEVEADFILLGGPHIPAMRQVDNKLIVCPGSLGQPRYGVSDPTFAAWQDGRVQIHHLHYHPQDTMRKLALLPLDPEHVLLLQSTLQTGGLK